MAERDFLALNKAAVQSGLTTAQEQQQYRATHDIRKKDDSERMASKSTLKFDEDAVFGISTRYRGIGESYHRFGEFCVMKVTCAFDKIE